MGRRGVILDPLSGDLEVGSRMAEAAGFDAIWVLETRHDSTIQATLALRATDRVTVGTNVTLAFPRSPTVTAMQAWDLNYYFDDRFILGLGSQIRRFMIERYSAPFDHPARRMAEYVQAVRTVWNMERGDPTPFNGEFYQVSRPGVAGLTASSHRSVPRVYVAAVGPLMTQTAAVHADGILGHPFTSARYIATTVVPRVESGLAGADRGRDEFRIVQSLIVSIADDRGRAVHDAKCQIAFYATTPNYERILASHGYDELGGQLRRAWRETAGDADALARLVPDEAVDHYAVAGTPDEVAGQLTEIERHVDEVILGGPWYGVDPARISENTQAIIETLGPPTPAAPPAAGAPQSRETVR